MGEVVPDRPASRPERAGPGEGPGVGSGGRGRRQQRYYRGVAAVPQRPVVADGETGELPPLPAPEGRSYSASRAMRPGQRWRSLRHGGGWTMAGLWIAVICWGIWVVSRGGGDLVGPAFALGLVIGTGALVFTVSRLLGRMVLEGMLGRPRFSAWPSHMMVFLLLVIGGLAFLQQTRWVVFAWNWVFDALL